MGERKTVYELSWNPSPVSVITFFASLAALLYVPYWYQLPIFFNSLLAIPLELVAAAGIVWFFYHGLERANQAKVLYLFLTIFSILGFASNLFYQSTFLLTSKTLATDGFIVGMLNACAIAVTLSCYRLKAIQIEADISGRVASTKAWWLKISPPALTAIVALLTVWVMCGWKSAIVSDTFAVNITYFIGLQLLFNVGGTFYFFRSKTRLEKIKLSFLVIAIATGLGTLSNVLHRHTTLRPGDRLELQSMDFIIMNAGALIIVLTYELWKRHLKSEAEKSAARQASAEPSTDSPATPTAPAQDTEKKAAEYTKPGEAGSTERTEVAAGKKNNKSDEKSPPAADQDKTDEPPEAVSSTQPTSPKAVDKTADEKESTATTGDSKPVEAEHGINK